MKRIIIIAGDKSGDLYGGLLCKKLKEKFSDIEIFSFGGANLAQHSHQIINLLSFSVSGIIEVLFSLKELFDIFKKAVEEINKINPDLIILIDFPDFNLRLAEVLNNRYRLFYYVSPQIWAWRKERIKAIKKYINKMIVIFKFEEEFYKNEGMNVNYFGHPLLEIIEKKNLQPKKIISFMPGSRKNEIKKHLPVMVGAKKIIEKELVDYCFRIIRPENLEEKIYKKYSKDIEIVNHSYQTIEESEFIITSSGTATVEIAILEVPFLIIYKLNPLTWRILLKMVRTNFVGMVNILSSQKIVQELLQKEANPENIAQKTLSLLKDRTAYENLKQQLKKINEFLSPYGATDKFADFIGKYLNLSRR